MKTIILLLILLIPVSIFAAGIEYESITVADTAVGFNATKILGKVHAFCTLETAQIRYRIDAVPTSTTGHLVNVNDVPKFNSYELGVKFIRTGTTSATLNCTYE